MNRPIAVLALLALIVAAPGFAQRHHSAMPPMTGDPAGMLIVGHAGVGGIVQTVSGTLITIANGAITIDASKATIRNLQGDAVAVSAIKPGDRIDVIAASDTVAAGAPIVAERITVARTDVISLSGTIQSISATSKTFTLLGRTIAVASDTKFAGANAFADLKAADRVVVVAEVRSGVLTALTVFAMHTVTTPPAGNFVTNVTGTAKSITASTWVIATSSGDVSLLIDEHTFIQPGIVAGDAVFATAINTTTPPTAMMIVKTGLGPHM